MWFCLFLSVLNDVILIYIYIFFRFIDIVWNRRRIKRAQVRAIQVNVIVRDSMPSWTHWPVFCLTRRPSYLNWTVSPSCGCPSVTCALKAIFKVFQFNSSFWFKFDIYCCWVVHLKNKRACIIYVSRCITNKASRSSF